MFCGEMSRISIVCKRAPLNILSRSCDLRLDCSFPVNGGRRPGHCLGHLDYINVAPSPFTPSTMSTFQKNIYDGKVLFITGGGWASAGG